MRKFSVLFLIALLVLASCTNYNKILIQKVEINSFKIKSTSSADIQFKLSVSNSTNKDIFIKNIEGEISNNGSAFASIILVKSDTLLKKSNGKYLITINAILTDPMILTTIGLNPKNWNPEEFTIAGSIVFADVRGGQRKVKIKNYSVKSLMGKL